MTSHHARRCQTVPLNGCPRRCPHARRPVTTGLNLELPGAVASLLPNVRGRPENSLPGLNLGGCGRE